MKFKDKVREGRLNQKMTQQALADAIGVSLRTLRNYESGERYPRDRKLYRKLADVLQVDINYLFTEDTDFTLSVHEAYGARSASQARKMVETLGGMFAGGELTEDDMDAVMKAMQQFYWDAKESNKKYIPKKYRDNE